MVLKNTDPLTNFLESEGTTEPLPLLAKINQSIQKTIPITDIFESIHIHFIFTNHHLILVSLNSKIKYKTWCSISLFY